VEWDPTGRYIATSSSVWKHTVSHSRERGWLLARKWVSNSRFQRKHLVWEPPWAIQVVLLAPSSSHTCA
jgi:uncharacterized protein with WD repeat